MVSSSNLRGFLQGIQVFVRIKGFKLNVFSPTRSIFKRGELRPNFAVDLDGFNIFGSCHNDALNRNLVVKLGVSLNHVMMIDQALITNSMTQSVGPMASQRHLETESRGQF